MNAIQYEEPGSAQLERMEELLLSISRKLTWQTEDNEAKYAWIAAVLKAQRNAKLAKREKGVVRRFLQKVTATSRAQLTRLIGQWMEDRPSARICGPPHQRGHHAVGGHRCRPRGSIRTAALKAVWYQKWFVHRWLRPEASGGAVHNHLTKRRQYPIHSDVLNSTAVGQVFSKYGTYLLPQAFPEGSPLHPSY